jgi:hypothetical protein
LATMFTKFDVSDIIRSHYRTFYDNSLRAEGRSRIVIREVVGILLLPAAIGTVVLFTHLTITDPGSLLAGIAIFGGLLFALLILLLEQAAGAAFHTEEQGYVSDRVRERAVWLREISANVAYAVLVSLAATILLVAGLFVHLPPGTKTAAMPFHLITGLAVAVTVVLTHLLLTVLMVMKRAFALLGRELNRATVKPDRG